MRGRKLRAKRPGGWPLGVALGLTVILAGCSEGGAPAASKPPAGPSAHAAAAASAAAESAATDATSATVAKAAWDADEQPSTVYYEIFVRSFYDSDGDGIGDLKGVAEKLDYLKELGVGGIWLMPVNPSPSYHGYDVTDYYSVNPDYGTMDDLRNLVAEAHRRGIKVILDLVVNHTSSEHPWFKQALADPNSPYRSWYTFATAGEQVPADSAAGSGSPWHEAGGGTRYLGIFSEAMPDLNYDEPAVREEMIKVGKFWLAQGVDGFRLDAAKHIYGDFASTVHSPEVAQNNLAWWRQFRSGLTEVDPNVYLVGEVWDSASVIAPLLNQALDSAFNFELADRILSAADRETDPDVAFTLKRVYGAYETASKGAFVDAPFLSNHDQNRTMSVLGGDVDHAKMAASVLLTLPGNPFLYYGEEIGMRGMKPDESIREPMIWYAGAAGGAGQTTWEPVRSNKDGAVSVEAEDKDESSLLNHYRMLLQWRGEDAVLRDGSIDEFETDSPGIGAYVRMTRSERELVVLNMSGRKQSVKLDGSGKYGAFTSIVHAGSKDGVALRDGTLTLPPYTTAVLR